MWVQKVQMRARASEREMKKWPDVYVVGQLGAKECHRRECSSFFIFLGPNIRPWTISFFSLCAKSESMRWGGIFSPLNLSFFL